MSDFKSFPKIAHIGKLFMTITEKLDGTNAQIVIYPDENGALQLRTGSRNRWIAPGDDNFGFAKFVYDNKQRFIDVLGEGSHYGEWCGPGIGNGCGLKKRKLFLFNWRRWRNVELPEDVSYVKVIHSGKCSLDEVERCMMMLKESGSITSPGFMKPEGVVIEVAGTLYKNVFSPEEIAWKNTLKKEPAVRCDVDVAHLLQPLRLEKLFSRDEAYIRDYPASLPAICAAYVKDLEEEGQITGLEEEVKAIKKSLGRCVFRFVKAIICERNNHV